MTVMATFSSGFLKVFSCHDRDFEANQNGNGNGNKDVVKKQRLNAWAVQ